MGKDVILTVRNPMQLAYDPAKGLVDDGEVALRLLNGPIAKDLIGFSWLGSGYDLRDLPTDWRWDAQWGGEYGALPGPSLLMASRMPMAILSGLAAGLVFLLGRALGGNFTGLAACLLYALDPLVLVHGRRAMAEGALLFSLLLSLVATVELARRLRRRPRWEWLWNIMLTALLGGVIAFAISSKQTNAPVLFVAIVACASAVVRRPGVRTAESLTRAGVIVAVLVFACGTVFLLLNPVAWRSPLRTAGAMIAIRDIQTRAQIESVIADGRPQDVLTTVGSRAVAAVDNSFGMPAFWDVPKYAEYLEPQREAYYSFPLTRLLREWPLNVGLAVLCVLGLLASVARMVKTPTERDAEGVLIGWLISAVILIVVAIPLNWQRYFVSALPPIWFYAALGLGVVGQSARGLLWRRG